MPWQIRGLFLREGDCYLVHWNKARNKIQGSILFFSTNTSRMFHQLLRWKVNNMKLKKFWVWVLSTCRQKTDTIILVRQQLQVAPPTGVCEWNQHHRGLVSAGGGHEAGTGVHAPLFQREGFQFSGKVVQHAGVVELHPLQRVPAWGWEGRTLFLFFLKK